MAIRTSYVKATNPQKTSTFEGGITINGTMSFGDAATDTLTVTGAATFGADSTFSTTKKLQFRDTGLYVNSPADGKLKISADGTGNDDITISGTTVFDAGMTVKHVSKSANYTATLNDYIIGVDTSGGAVTITIPSAAAVAGKLYIINDEGADAGTHNITVATEGSETIDGSASGSIATNNGTLRIYSDGTNWFTW